MHKKRIGSSSKKVTTAITLFLIALGTIATLSVAGRVLAQVAASETQTEKAIGLQKAASPEASAATPVPEVIPVADVAMRAGEVTNLLRDLNTKLASTEKLDSIGKLLPQKAERVNRQFRETRVILEGAPSLAVLQTQQQLWQGTQTEMSTWLRVLTARATLLKQELGQLSTLYETWVRTLRAANAGKAPQPVLQQIGDVLSAIFLAKQPLETQDTATLDLQNRVAHELAQCSTILTLILQAQQREVGGILTRDSLPIWSPDLWARLASAFPERLREVTPAWQAQMSQYLRDPAMGLPVHMGLFAVLVILCWAARRRVRGWKTGGEDISSALMVFERPFAAALLVTLGTASGPHSGAPSFVKVVLELMAFFPAIRLIKPVVNPRVFPGLYTLWFLFALDAIRQALSGGLFNGQLILIVETLVGAIVLMWSLASGHVRRTSARVDRSLRSTVLRAGAVLVFVTLTAGAAAGILGYVSLARILASEVIAGAAMALVFCAVVLISMGIVAFSFRVWPLRCLYMMTHLRSLLERRARQALVCLAVVMFAVRLLDYSGFLSATLSFFQDILAFKLERGSISISVEDILVFFLTVWAAYILSGFLRFILREDVYPRIGVQKGLAYATSSLINYVILAIGFVVGLGVIGVSLTSITVLAGAFGVGIGFGLQGIVNNFVSGLILLFERPLHVGDMVEFGDLLGEVQRIGIRASTVRTVRGADIIVPNADLVTKQVTNWTLGDKLRRIDLPVGVVYGSNPEEVIKILERVANTHNDVLRTPSPQCLLTGYGDNSINFELRAWTDEIDDWPRIRSDLAVAVYHAADEAGIALSRHR